MELTIAVVRTGLQKICQDVIFVRRANQLADRQPHKLCKVSCEDIAEITGRNAYVHQFAHLKTLCVEQVTVSRNVIYDLRSKSTPVDRVCTGKEEALLIECVCSVGICENALDTGLCIIKVSVNSTYVDVITLLRNHLQLLNLADSVDGVEYGNTYLINVTVAFKRSFARITGSCDQNQRFALLTGLFERTRQQARHDLQCHILECCGGAVPKLLGIYVVANVMQRGCATNERIFVISLHTVCKKLFLGIIGQILAQNKCRSVRVIHAAKGRNLVNGKSRDTLGYKQTTVVSQSFSDDLCGREFFLF